MERADGMDADFGALRIAVLIPCYNEALAVRSVIQGFAKALPTATILVYDNNSTDGTAELARQAGALVRFETRQGKGYVVRRMFADIEADLYVMVDGDGTYDPSAVREMIRRLLSDNLDMVNGARQENVSNAYRRGHKFGNALLSGLVRAMFGQGYRDMLSGYRVMSRRFVKSFPMTSSGFELETELSIHSLDMDMPVAEVSVPFCERADGAESKLRTLPDGFRILWMILKLLKQEKPLLLFGVVTLLLVLLSIGLAVPLFVTYSETGLVPRLPTAILVTGLMIVAMLSFLCGLVLDTVSRGRREVKLLHYLREPGVSQIHVGERGRGA